MPVYPQINVPMNGGNPPPQPPRRNWWETGGFPGMSMQNLQGGVQNFYQQNPNAPRTAAPQPTWWGNLGGALQGAVNALAPLHPAAWGNAFLSGQGTGGAPSQQPVAPSQQPVAPRTGGQANAPYAPEGATSYQGQPDRYQGPTLSFANRGGGNGAGTAAQTPISIRMQVAQKELDPRLGEGWSANFERLHGTDPITFYMKSLGLNENDLANAGFNVDRAIQAAQWDARIQQGGVEEWQRLHGNTPIPDEQYQTWWRLGQANQGNPIYGAGAGINPWGVY